MNIYSSLRAITVYFTCIDWICCLVDLPVLVAHVDLGE